MTSTSSPEPTHIVSSILERVQRKGVRIWSENGQLRFKAPKGALTQEELAQLQRFKRLILELLQGAEAVESIGTAQKKPALHCQQAPMAYSQLAHWNLYRLEQRRSLRQIASATRLRGKLHIHTFCRSVSQVVQRHDALRTRIVSSGGTLMQEIAPDWTNDMAVEDLSNFARCDRGAAIFERIQEFILEPIDVSRDSLFGAKLLKTSECEHVLILAMEHMISDAVSMGILLRDLMTTYGDLLMGKPSRLPAIPVQFPDFAAWRAAMQPDWTQKHGGYWRRHLEGCERLRFPRDIPSPDLLQVGWGTIPVPIVPHLKGRLTEWSRNNKTTLVMAVFTAYAALVLRWCDASSGLFQYQTDGRAHPSLQHTIGFFASVLYLKVELREADTFADLLNRITSEYCAAYEHADQSFMESRTPRPDFARNTCFNWVSRAPQADLSELDDLGDLITCHPFEFEHPMLKFLERDNEPMALFYDTDEGISGGVYFPLRFFSTGLMERFTRNLMAFIDSLLNGPEVRVKDIALLQ